MNEIPFSVTTVCRYNNVRNLAIVPYSFAIDNDKYISPCDGPKNLNVFPSVKNVLEKAMVSTVPVAM